jgi:hypothetical protein
MNIESDLIERKAYELWERRGRPVGSPEVDWLEAESVLRNGAAEEVPVGSSATRNSGAPVRYGLRSMGDD